MVLQPFSNATYWESNQDLLQTIPLPRLIAMAQADWGVMPDWLCEKVSTLIGRSALPLIKGLARGRSTERARRLMPDNANGEDIKDMEQEAMLVLQEGLVDPHSPLGRQLVTRFASAVVTCTVTAGHRQGRKQHGVKSERVERTWPDPLTGRSRTTGRWLRTSPLRSMDPADLTEAMSSLQTPPSDVEFQVDLNAAEARIRDPKHRRSVDFLFAGKGLEEAVAVTGVGPRTIVKGFRASPVGEMLAERLAKGDGDEHRDGAREELRSWTGKGDVKQVGAGVTAGGGSVHAPVENGE